MYGTGGDVSEVKGKGVIVGSEWEDGGKKREKRGEKRKKRSEQAKQTTCLRACAPPARFPFAYDSSIAFSLNAASMKTPLCLRHRCFSLVRLRQMKVRGGVTAMTQPVAVSTGITQLCFALFSHETYGWRGHNQ